MAGKIKVLAGGLYNDKWKLGDDGYMKRGKEKYHMRAGIKTLEQLTDDKVKKLKGTAGWGFLGLVTLGPLGAIGGMLLGGNKKEITFAAETKNGHKFLAVTDGKTWQKIMTLRF